MPPALLLDRIEPQGVYFDKASIERGTNVLRRKYKVAGNVIESLKIYTFFVATSKEYNCQLNVTAVVEQGHWERVVSGYLQSPYTYLDVRKVEPLNETELLNKMRDPSNGFLCVARLCDEKYQELKVLEGRVRISCSRLPLEQITLIKIALQDIVDTSHVSDRILEKLGL